MPQRPGATSQEQEAVKRSEVRTVESHELLGGGGLLRIQHGGAIYTLRITRNDRLILTK